MGLALLMVIFVALIPAFLIGWFVASIIGLILKPNGSKAVIFGIITTVIFYAFMFHSMAEILSKSFTDGAGNDKRLEYCMILAILAPCIGVLVAKFISIVDPKNSKFAKKARIKKP